eukprot:1622536-Alexandrium_andersonii.AAC.1
MPSQFQSQDRSPSLQTPPCGGFHVCVALRGLGNRCKADGWKPKGSYERDEAEQGESRYDESIEE